MSKLKELLEHLSDPDLMAIIGMKTELGHKTERTRLNNLSQCEDWLRLSSSNSIRLIFDKEKEFIDISL